MLSAKIYSEILLNADGKALATYGSSGLNVVPVSTVKIVGEEIVLVNYFFNKTLNNINENPEVTLACWKGYEGFQIKGQARYETEGEVFAELVTWVKGTMPNRVVKGVLILTPSQVFDISASAGRAGQEVR